MPGLSDELLRAIGQNAHDTTACVGAPERTVPFRQNALRSLQVPTDSFDTGTIHGPAHEGIICSAHRMVCDRISTSVQSIDNSARRTSVGRSPSWRKPTASAAGVNRGG